MVRQKFRGLPYGPEQLDPSAAPILVATTVDENDLVDFVSDDGCVEAGLPASYPFDGAGAIVGWDLCQQIGQTCWTVGELGIACRSAATIERGGQEVSPGKELAWLEREQLREDGRQTFDEWWYWAVKQL